METVGVLAIAVGPIIAVLFLLWRSVKRTMFRWERQPILRPASPPHLPHPPKPDQLAGDRVPRRPLQPSLSGAAALPIPEVKDDEPLVTPPPTWTTTSPMPDPFDLAS